jgi:hypothetical protein
LFALRPSALPENEIGSRLKRIAQPPAFRHEQRALNCSANCRDHREAASAARMRMRIRELNRSKLAKASLLPIQGKAKRALLLDCFAPLAMMPVKRA